MWTLNKGGPKPSIVTAAILVLIGNWIRYAGARAEGGIFGLTMFGQILIGIAQPFCLSAPTRYSDLWFTDRGRTSATAVATLANPFGGALGQLVGPFLATESSRVSDMVLYVSIIVRLTCLASISFQISTIGPQNDFHPRHPAVLTENELLLVNGREFTVLFYPCKTTVARYSRTTSEKNTLYKILIDTLQNT